MLYRLILILLLNLALTSISTVQAANKRSEQNTAVQTKAADKKVRTEKRVRAEKKVRAERKRTISKSSAINFARSEVKGKVLSAKLIDSNGPAVYRVKMLVGESRVRTVFVDGASGKVIRIN